MVFNLPKTVRKGWLSSCELCMPSASTADRRKPPLRPFYRHWLYKSFSHGSGKHKKQAQSRLFDAAIELSPFLSFEQIVNTEKKCLTKRLFSYMLLISFLTNNNGRPLWYIIRKSETENVSGNPSPVCSSTKSPSCSATGCGKNPKSSDLKTDIGRC